MTYLLHSHSVCLATGAKDIIIKYVFLRSVLLSADACFGGNCFALSYFAFYDELYH